MASGPTGNWRAVIGTSASAFYKVRKAQIAIAVHVLCAVVAATMPLWYNSDALEGEEEQRMKFIRGSLYIGAITWIIVCGLEVASGKNYNKKGDPLTILGMSELFEKKKRSKQ